MSDVSAELLAASLDLLPDPTIAVDGTGTLLDANATAARLLGGERDDLRGADAQSAVRLFDEAGLDWWDCHRPLDADPRLLPRIAELDLLIQVPGGRTRPVLLTGARHADAGGKLALLVLSLRRGERRRRLDAARSELVSTVSHELRSPLTSVKGFTKTLLVKWDRFTDEQRKAMIATVHEDADRVTRLLGELLDVSRIDAGRLQLRRQMVDVEGVVARVLERAGATGPERTRTTHQERGEERLASDVPSLPRCYADPDKLAQVLTNLVENGLKYGAGAVTVTVREREEDLLVAVTDEGHGVAAAHLPHIFTKFFRPPGERRTGTGLGLYISKGIVEAHGGRIWADSTAAGARFSFTLPRGGLELAGVVAKDRA
ncbi:ATP-binding protein [soil metagenome]